MSSDTYYLTIGPDSKGRGLLAIISRGSPQLGDKDVTVCDVNVVCDMEEARAWYKQQMETMPWLARN